MSDTEIPFEELERGWQKAAEEVADFAERKVPEDPIQLRVLVDNLIHDFTELKRQRIAREGRRPRDFKELTTVDLKEIEADWLGRGFLRAANGLGYLHDLAVIDARVGALGN